MAGVSKSPPKIPDIVKKKLHEWADKSKRVRIFITGKTGTGKSTLVNGLVGRDVAKVGETLNPETSTVTRYGQKFNDISVEVWDSPGLADETEYEEAYLESIESEAINKDLYLFCISMSNTRLVHNSSEIKTMKHMTEKLGEHFWEHSVIVLTFANKVVQMAECNVDEISDESIMKYFTEQLEHWRQTLRKYLMETVELSKELVDRIKIIPAANSTMLALPDPDGANWMSKLWLECVAAARVDAQPALIKLNQGRLLFKDTNARDKDYVQRRLLEVMPQTLAKRGEQFGGLYDTSTAEFGRTLGMASGKVEAFEMLFVFGLKNMIYTLSDLTSSI